VRVISVLDGVLAKQKYLVGDRLTAADIVFFPWNNLIFNPPNMLDGSPYKAEILEKFPHFLRWHESVKEYPSVKRAYEIRKQVMGSA
jgi:glutathione S-transferase